MSKYDYSEYKCEIGDKVWIYDAGSGARVKGVIEATEQVTRKLITPRGKAKREFLKATKQGKWAEVFEVGDWVTCDDTPMSEKTRQIKKIDDNGCHWFVSRSGQNTYCYASDLRHATPEEIAEATKPVIDWSSVNYVISNHNNNVIKALFIDEDTVYGPCGYMWPKKTCKPITPAEMTREQAISILEGPE